MLTDPELKEWIELERQKDVEKARDDFYAYCQYLHPDFYKDSRPHLKELCDVLNEFCHNRLLKPSGEPFEKLMLRLPPQHGKSRTLVNLTQWCLGRNNNERIITGSYADGPAGDFSRYTRDGISEEKNMPDQRVFTDIFPDTKIKQGNASYQKWALGGQHFNYLGVGVDGSVTGKGATIRIADDLVKDIEVALSETQLEKIWRWFSGTFSSRNAAEGGAIKEIVCATLWTNRDPQGILENTEKEDWYIFSREILNRETGEMLCEDFMNRPSYEKLKARMLVSPVTEMIFWANYHSELVDTANLLYAPFEMYIELPLTIRKANYTDTADMGTDYLCSICYEKGKDGKIYVVDVLYTQESMEKTEVSTAMMLNRNDTKEAHIESNNGGRGFARVIEKTANATVSWFHQSGNKESRILTNSASVSSRIVFPVDWKSRWPVFAEHVTLYKKTFKSNKFDDAPDTLTGIIEKNDVVKRSEDMEVIWD